MLNLKDLIEKSYKDNLKLHTHINPQFAKVLSTIGFDEKFIKAKGTSLFNDKNEEYLDFLSGYGVYGIGRNHPKIKQAIKDYLDLDFPNLIQMEAPVLCGILAEKIIQIFGQHIRGKVFFTSTGTEANEAAIKFARYATQRNKLLHWKKAFHGLTNGSLSVNGNDEFKKGFGDLLPSKGIPMNDLEALENELKTNEYAAFIFEPIQGKGVFIPDQNYIQKAMELCKQYGTLTIADEVQTGIGRTGKWLACEHFNIQPDFVTISKALSGGMVQIGAVNYKTEIYDKVFSRMDRCVVHSSTFGKNNLGMVCGLATLDIMEEENLVENSEKIGSYLLEKLSKLKEKYDWIKEIRGKGLMIGIEFGKPTGFKNKLVWDTVHKIDKGLFGELIVMPLFSKHKILTQVSGHHQDIIKIIPPLILTQEQADKFISSLDSVLEDCGKATGPILKMGMNLAKHVVKKTGT